jgi:hypothetical protein
VAPGVLHPLDRVLERRRLRVVRDHGDLGGAHGDAVLERGGEQVVLDAIPWRHAAERPAPRREHRVLISLCDEPCTRRDEPCVLCTQGSARFLRRVLGRRDRRHRRGALRFRGGTAAACGNGRKNQRGDERGDEREKGGEKAGPEGGAMRHEGGHCIADGHLQ